MNLSQAIFAYEGRPTSVLGSILSQVVSSGTQGNYTNQNVDLILWIYKREERREELPRDWHKETPPMNLSQAISAYEGRPTSVVESILSQVVSSVTQGNCTNHNVDLILWIYKREEWREELLRDWMVDRLIDAKEKGKK